jgi:hypothetical protein
LPRKSMELVAVPGNHSSMMEDAGNRAALGTRISAAMQSQASVDRYARR